MEDITAWTMAVMWVNSSQFGGQRWVCPQRIIQVGVYQFSQCVSLPFLIWHSGELYPMAHHGQGFCTVRSCFLYGAQPRDLHSVALPNPPLIIGLSVSSVLPCDHLGSRWRFSQMSWFAFFQVEVHYSILAIPKAPILLRLVPLLPPHIFSNQCN